MQTYSHMYKSSLQCFRKLFLEEGIRGVYKGSLAPIISLVPTNALIFAGEDAARSMLEKSNSPYLKFDSLLGGFFCGSFGGICSLVALVPGDVVKCKMQVDGINISTGVASKYNGVYDAIKHIYKTEGFLAFYKGTVATACREVPSIGTYFTVYNNFKLYFTPKNQETPAWVTLIGGGIAGSTSWGVVYPFDVIKSNIQIATGWILFIAIHIEYLLSLKPL
jgi:solute carrier family 25 carnitine/acylcarnitine transporter 20/29